MVFMMVILSIRNKMKKEKCDTIMDKNIMVDGKMIGLTVMELYALTMERNILVNWKMARWSEKEFTALLMEIDIKVNGKMTK